MTTDIPPRPRPRGLKGSNALAQTWYMTQRQLMAIVRQPAYLLITLVQPVIWLFLFGNLFKKVVQLGGFGTTSYLDYLVPGIVLMSASAPACGPAWAPWRKSSAARSTGS